MEHTITIPSSLSLAKTLKICADVRAIPNSERILFDFAKMSHIPPFAMLMLSANFQDAVNARPQGFGCGANFTKHHYAAHMGFFKAFNLDFGNNPGEASGSGTYVPITIEDLSALRFKAARDELAVGELVEEKAYNLAKVLAGVSAGPLVDVFTYSIREIIRNSAEHSKSKIVEFCAQYWPSKDKAEIAILDRGIGIHESLKTNPFLKIDNQQHAINLSLLPGISGKNYKGVEQTGDDWQNTGFGLYITQRICRNHGSFFLGSIDTSIYLGAETKRYEPFNFPGTVVRLNFSPSKVGDHKTILSKYSLEGAQYAKENLGITVSASSASMMLSRDFSK